LRSGYLRAAHYPSGPFTTGESGGKLALGDGMPFDVRKNNRRGNRTKAVIPVRVKGQDSAGKPFEALVITLDVTPDGVRLGSVHHELNVLDELTVFYRQRRIQFRVVWTKKMKGTSEFQVGLQALTQESEAWGLNFSEYRRQPASQPAVAQTSGMA
jgi:hypothetical protein